MQRPPVHKVPRLPPPLPLKAKKEALFGASQQPSMYHILAYRHATDNGTNATAVHRAAGNVPAPNLILSHFQGTPGFAVVVLAKFLRAYLEDVSTNTFVAQSDPVLSFLSLLSPFRAIKINCLEQFRVWLYLLDD
jgi:hypothetical protein